MSESVCALEKCTIRQRKELRDSDITADARVGMRVDRFGNFALGLKRHVPQPGFEPYRHVLDLACDLTFHRPLAGANGHPADFWEKYGPTRKMEALRKA